MYCSNCGEKADGKFCPACGSRLKPPADVERQPVVKHPDPPVANDDWVNEIVYERLLQAPTVRDRITQAGQRNQKQISGEDLLGLFDTVVPTGVSLKNLTVALLPVYDRMGIKVGRKSTLKLKAPAGRVLLGTLCATAGKGYEIKNVEQLPDGCVLTATLPSTLWTNRGELVIGLQCCELGVQIEAATKVPGQLFDWGKSNRILSELFDEIRQEIRSQRNADPPQGRNVA